MKSIALSAALFATSTGFYSAYAQGFPPPIKALANSYGINQGWQISENPRLLGDVDGDGRADIVGFADSAVFVALGQSDGTFGPQTKSIESYTINSGNWRVGINPRFLGDVNGDGRADIVGFGNSNVYVALGTPAGGFTEPVQSISAFGSNVGWSGSTYPRHLGDVNGDGRADIIGFGDSGTFVALGQEAAPYFGKQFLAVAAFGPRSGGWSTGATPRLLGDVNGDGRTDIVGFGYTNVYISLGQSDGKFATPVKSLNDFGLRAGGWQVAKNPRLLGDINGDGYDDIVGFGNSEVYYALGTDSGGFQDIAFGVAGFTAGQGWKGADSPFAPGVEVTPRILADIDGDGRDDIVGFGDNAVFISFYKPNGGFTAPVSTLLSFTPGSGGWEYYNNPRLMADVTGDGRADIVGFGDSDVFVSLSRSNVEHYLTASRYVTSVLSDSDADAILASAGSILQQFNGTGDVACPVGFQREGTVSTFNNGDGAIRTGAEIRAIFALPGNVKIVNLIQFCGGPGGGIIGCAPLGGRTFVAVRYVSNLEGILWAHEFGHNEGLAHRNGGNFIMNPAITPTAKRVDAAECTAFQNPLPTANTEFYLTGDPDFPDSVAEFARRHYVRGVPYAAAKAYAETETTALHEILENPDEQEYWSNAATLIGMIGDSNDAVRLISFIEENKADAGAPLSYRAILDAVLSLGYLVHHTGDDTALDYLSDAANTLRRRTRPQRARRGEEGLLRLDQNALGQSALLGLALSGRPEAGAILLELANRRRASEDTRAAAGDALDIHAQVNANGLEAYYAAQKQ